MSNYKVIEEIAVIDYINLEVSFVYKGKFYRAVGILWLNDFSVDDVEVIWNDGEINHHLDIRNPVFEIGLSLLDTMELDLENMEINKKIIKR